MTMRRLIEQSDSGGDRDALANLSAEMERISRDIRAAANKYAESIPRNRYMEMKKLVDVAVAGVMLLPYKVREKFEGD